MDYHVTDAEKEKFKRIDTYLKTVKTLDRENSDSVELEKFYLKEINGLFLDLGMNLYWAMKEQNQ